MSDTAQSSHTFLHPASFPSELRRAKRWLLWKNEPRNPDEPPTKVPYYASPTGVRMKRNGKLDTPRDVARLVDYKAAVAAFNADPGFYTGLGFALGDGWYGIDFDHVRDRGAAGVLPPWVATMIAHGIRGGMYAEVSPSGTGLHLIGLWPPGSRFRNGRQHEHVEAYHSGRFFTMTGDRLRGVARLKVLDPVPTLVQLPAEGRPALRLVAEDGRQTAQIDAGARESGKVTSTWLANRPAVVEALAVLTSDCPREPWRDVGMALHHGSHGNAEGLALWEQWSAKAAGRPGKDGPRYVPGHCAEQWGSFGKSDAPPITLGTLFDMAKKARAQQQDVPRETSKPTRVLPGNLPDEFSAGELELMDIPPTRWLVADLIAPGFTLLAAPPKAGKSYLAVQMALCVAAGRPFLDRETTASPVCYFDLEQWHAIIRPRQRDISKGHGIDPAKIPMRYKLTIGAGDGALALMREQVERGVKLIVVDLFVKARDELSEDAKKNAYARDYAAVTKIADFALQYPDVAIVVIHHANKGKHDEWQAKISGSYGLTGASHANVYLERPDLRGMEKEDKDYAMNYRVLRAQGKLIEEQEVVIEKMPAKGGWQCSKVKAWEISATMLQGKLMLALDPKYPAYTSAKDIADIVGRPYVGVRKMLLRMAALGMIESEGQGGAGYRVRR